MNDTNYEAIVVDDEVSIQELVARCLQVEGFHCDLAADGKIASEMISAHSYDAVVTDLKMPIHHGHALAVEILANEERPAIVVLTGVLEPKLVKDLIARGVDSIEFKPIEFALLAAKVKALVNRRRRQRRANVDSDRQLAGIFDSQDRFENREHQFVPSTVSEVMVRNVNTITPKASLRELTKRITSTGFRHWPVVDSQGKLLGITTQRDLYRYGAHLGRVGGELSDARVSDVMRHSIQSTTPSTSVYEAAQIMVVVSTATTILSVVSLSCTQCDRDAKVTSA